MSNVFEYIKFRGDLPFRISPFNEVDALLLSISSYLDFTGLIEGAESLETVSKKYSARCESQGSTNYNDKERCFFEMAKVERFKNIKMENYQKDISEEEIKTYYALTYVLAWNQIVVAFPGTDTTMLSWQENFTFLYKNPAPGQEQCLEYLSQAMKNHPFAKTRIVGHSKGGNLSAYAAMNISQKLQRRITDIYLFDAPGYIYDISENEGFLRIKSRLHSFIPEDCVVGELFRVPYPDRAIISSCQKRFMQHDMTTWLVVAGEIERGEGLSKFSEITSSVFNRLVDCVDESQRELVVTEIFDLIRTHGINDLSDVSNMKLSQSLKMMIDLPKISPESKMVLKTLLKEIKNA